MVVSVRRGDKTSGLVDNVLYCSPAGRRTNIFCLNGKRLKFDKFPANVFSLQVKVKNEHRKK